MRLRRILAIAAAFALMPVMPGAYATDSETNQIPERAGQNEKITIYIAGDSTAQTYDYTKVYPQTGWGQVFGDYFTDDVAVENRAMGGRSSKSYDNDGRLDKILDELQPGDYVFIQFGINDGAVNKPERYISVEDYKELIANKYIGEVKKRGGIPVLMTATAASWWDEENGRFMESRADYADPTRELAAELGVRFIDINRMMTDTWNTSAKDYVLSGYFICEPLESKAYPTGTDDHTHLKEAGARRIAKMIAEAIPECVPELAPYLKSEEQFSDISGHWAEDIIKGFAVRGTIQGDGTGHFYPDGAVTRAEFLKMAMDAAGIAPHAYREGECLDASNDDWYCYYLQSALDKGIIPVEMISSCVGKETADKVIAEATDEKEAVTAAITVYNPNETDAEMSFDGDQPITREEMAAIAVNCMNTATNMRTQKVFESISEFADAEMIDTAYSEAMGIAAALDVIEGDDDGMLRPADDLTRAEAITVAQRINIASVMF